MYECNVSRIDQADDRVIYISGHYNLFNKQELLVSRSQEVRNMIRSAIQLRFVLWDVHPNGSVDFFAGILEYLNFFGIKLFISQRRYPDACTGMVELPTMITALQDLSVIPSL